MQQVLHFVIYLLFLLNCLHLDGVEEDDKNVFCRQISRVTEIRNTHCRPLTKIYYVQYQYFPFYIASLAIAFYIPYLIFGVINGDMMNLKTGLYNPYTFFIRTNNIYIEVR